MGPLPRITVIDLARVRSGPTAVRQLADWGANVIKIEAPEDADTGIGMGGERHGPDFQNVHRNKRGITLNLKKPEGLAALRRLAALADVVVENYGVWCPETPSNAVMPAPLRARSRPRPRRP